MKGILALHGYKSGKNHGKRYIKKENKNKCLECGKSLKGEYPSRLRCGRVGLIGSCTNNYRIRYVGENHKILGLNTVKHRKCYIEKYKSQNKERIKEYQRNWYLKKKNK